MPRLPPKVNYTQHESDENDEEEETQSQSQRKSQLSSEARTKYAGLVCNYLLTAESKKIPVGRADIRKIVLKEHGRHFSAVMAEAAVMLKKVYAYRVVALKKKNNFILINNLGTSYSDNDSSSKNEAAKMGLLTAILTAIFMTGEVMQEGPMREYLKKLSVDVDTKEVHPVFGNVSKLIYQEFVKQKYIDITQDTATDPPTREYRWGERAHQELSKRNVIDLVCKVYGNNMRPEVWTSQWKIALREENGPQETNPEPSRSHNS